MNDVISPITKTRNVELIHVVKVQDIRQVYSDHYGCDIAAYFPMGLTEISLYKCRDSGLMFWWPDSIVGDDRLYAKLSEKSWYYMKNKWEFSEAATHISNAKGVSILEIGSAKGDFLQYMSRTHADAKLTGLELNKEAAAAAVQRGFNVIAELSGEHALSHESVYDVIVSFQVLEHVPNPMELIGDSLRMLKTGGQLIIAVPDNSRRAFPSLFAHPYADLSMPPHHQTQWSIPSLSYLAKLLPIRLEHLITEPATAHHHSTSYRFLMKQDLMRRLGRFLGFIVYALGRPFYDHALGHLNKHLPAHTILAIYRKLDA